ncbi:MAG: glycine/sarcosine/betaine reductase component B subunit [Dehalococcoidia bacterium]
MKLVVGEYPINEIIFGQRTSLEGTRLVVKRADLEAMAAEEDALDGIEAAVARPGEAVRIIHVLDAVEAMDKVEGPGTVYPGFLGPAVTVGRGLINKLTGMLVVSTTEFPEPMAGGLAFREGIIDMTGPGQPYCQASNTINLVLRYVPRPGVSNRELDDAVRRSTLRIAHLLGATSRGLAAANRRAFELGPVAPNLPRVAYIDQIMSQTLMTRTFIYGQELGDTLPTLVHPNELICGAMVTGNYKNSQKVSTYLHCNKPLVMELYGRHGVDLNFVGVVINRGHRDNHMLKERGAQYAAKVAKLIGAEGAVIAFEGGGNATVDFMLTVQACEQLGIRAVAEMYEHAAVGSGEFPIVYHVPEADALVSRGAQGEAFTAPAVDRLLGGSHRLPLYEGKVIEDAAQSFPAASSNYFGVDWQLGESGFVAREY